MSSPSPLTARVRCVRGSFVTPRDDLARSSRGLSVTILHNVLRLPDLVAGANALGGGGLGCLTGKGIAGGGAGAVFVEGDDDSAARARAAVAIRSGGIAVDGGVAGDLCRGPAGRTFLGGGQ